MRTPYNVVAAFEEEMTARSAVDLLIRRGVPRLAIGVERGRNGDSGDAIAEQRAEMQAELWTFLCAGAGAAIGVIGGLIWAYGMDSSLSPLARILIITAICGVAGATIGFIAGGGIEPRLEGRGDSALPLDEQRTAAERDVLVGVHVDERDLAERAAGTLFEMGAERVDLVDAQGTPLPPQSEHPRPG